MISIIICEGVTDLVLLQYFLEKRYDWTYIKDKDFSRYSEIMPSLGSNKNTKWLRKGDNNFMCIKSAGGCGKICNVLNNILEINTTDFYHFFNNIAILTDNDDIDTPANFLSQITDTFNNFHISFQSDVLNNEWNETMIKNSMEESVSINLLPLIIPFDENGAIETFLLNSIKQHSNDNDPKLVDKLVVEQCINFINTIDCKDKYLKRRRDKTKAQFDTVFVVMTPADAFNNRRELLRNIPWEEYELVQQSFSKLSHLG